jgi:hypothetical protein
MSYRDETPYDILTEKWNPVLKHEALPSIGNEWKTKVTAVLLENQEQNMRDQYLSEGMATGSDIGGVVSGTAQGGIRGYDPILISLVRRAMPNLMAYDICGVQPMTAPTGLIFAMRAKYGDSSLPGVGNEAQFQEPDPRFSGVSGPSGGFTAAGGTSSVNVGVNPYGTTGASYFAANNAGNFLAAKAQVNFDSMRAMLTSSGENLDYAASTSATNVMNKMSFTIDRVAVAAGSRALSAGYTVELAQDLKAVHGLDAEAELANLLSTEILAEINREIVRSIYWVAKSGTQQTDITGAGTYNLDLDSDGRWSAERFRGLVFQIERECNAIAKETRRGKGNFVIVSSDVASALAMSGFLNLSPAINTQLAVDDTGSTFAGLLNGKLKVYIDPYSQLGVNFFCVGYKGESPYDAGVFYCPYVPLQMMRAIDPGTFQPRIAFKTRYGMVANPYVLKNDGTPYGSDFTNQSGANQYYRLTRVNGLHGNTYGN